MKRHLVLGLLAAALLGLPLLGSRYLVDLTTEVAIYALFALSLAAVAVRGAAAGR